MQQRAEESRPTRNWSARVFASQTPSEVSSEASSLCLCVVDRTHCATTVLQAALPILLLHQAFQYCAFLPFIGPFPSSETTRLFVSVKSEHAQLDNENDNPNSLANQTLFATLAPLQVHFRCCSCCWTWHCPPLSDGLPIIDQLYKLPNDNHQTCLPSSRSTVGTSLISLVASKCILIWSPVQENLGQNSSFYSFSHHIWLFPGEHESCRSLRVHCSTK